MKCLLIYLLLNGITIPTNDFPVIPVIYSCQQAKDISQLVTEAIAALPEVKERARYIEEQSNHARHLAIWGAEELITSDANIYWVKVGEDNGTNLVTHFNFIVYYDKMRIMFYDVAADKEIGLEAWRKQLKKSK